MLYIVYKVICHKHVISVVPSWSVLFAVVFLCTWLCCEYLEHTCCCKTDEDVFLICGCFLYLHVFSSELSQPLYLTQ